ncbi:protein RTE1-HOMOLOG-like isoform X2 [Macadamia integrifolia]|uniref:protein RTE1-HOMOLOG-like isoform X2 n=1 Tax=Macadamia integrifolia TaxID=60698 RepID=UPI001C4F43B0|nr:protein RTE1-HOMOLOG-like isoform X2 [Macadamia integrifolia]
MESNIDPGSDDELMPKKITPENMQIDPKRARFPCSIVWTPLPVISWFLPFIGHIGICREDGVILDFAGPNFVCVDNFTFGAVARYIQLNREKCWVSPSLGEHEIPDRYGQSDPVTERMTWDDALRRSTQEFQHRSYNLFTCNCHSFVANNLNRLGYGGTSRWNVVNLATVIFLKGCWVNKMAIVRSILPFILVLSLGLMFGGWTFVTGLASFAFILVGWFLLGTYCFKSLIQL